MAGNKYQKLKLLYIYDILKKYTDDGHSLSAEMICERLAEYGIICERKSIYADIEVLKDYGLDIICSHAEPRGFALVYREFEAPEVRLLCNAVESAGFISEKKTKDLVGKLQGLLSEKEAKKINRDIFIDNRHKSDNEKTYLIIDGISEAISAGVKITVRYAHSVLKNGKRDTETKSFTVSPYALAWFEDHYYLICNVAKYDNLMHLRVDRMTSVDLLKDPARPFGEVSEYKTVFDTADYVGRLFNMYGGEKQTVKFRCEDKLLDQIIDKFGKKIICYPDGDGKFGFTADVFVSEGFIGSILQYGGALEVVSPAKLREDIAERVKKLNELYK